MHLAVIYISSSIRTVSCCPTKASYSDGRGVSFPHIYHMLIPEARFFTVYASGISLSMPSLLELRVPQSKYADMANAMIRGKFLCWSVVGALTWVMALRRRRSSPSRQVARAETGERRRAGAS